MLEKIKKMKIKENHLGLTTVQPPYNEVSVYCYLLNFKQFNYMIGLVAKEPGRRHLRYAAHGDLVVPVMVEQ